MIVMAELLLSHPAVGIAGVVALGAASQWFAWRVGVPAILPLLVIGFVAGPLTGWLNPTAFIGEDLLFPLVSLAVGLILFEGGLTLSLPEVRETRGVVVRLVTLGALVTWFGGAMAAWWLTDLPLSMAFLFGALIIVTGPTVIGPLLRFVRPKGKVGNVLKWEGLLIDAIGALAAVLVFEFLLIENRQEALGQTILLFLRFVLVGTLVGVVGGGVLAWLLKNRKVPDYLTNLVALAFVFSAFALANVWAPEAGLLSTVLMGMMLANLRVPKLSELLSFKEDLTVLFISLLFIVLAANVDLGAFTSVLTGSSLALLLVVMFVLRPLGIWASTWGSSMTWREKVFLSWIAPRGIVAAAVSSLFASKLVAAGFEGSDKLVPLVFLVIVGTVLLGSLTAKPVANLLGVAEGDAQGFLLLGAHPFARQVARYLKSRGLPTTVADTNWSNVAAARSEGLNAYYGSVLSDRSDDELSLAGIGRLLALTSNDEANALAALKYGHTFGSGEVYQLPARRGGPSGDALSIRQRGRFAFGPDVDFTTLARAAERGYVLRDVTPEERAAAPKDTDGPPVIPLFWWQGERLKMVTGEGAVPDPAATWVVLGPRDG